MNDYRAYPIGTQQAAVPSLGYATTGYEQVEKVAERPRLDILADRLENLPNAAAHAIERVKRMADRLGGSVPQSVDKDAGCASAPSITGRIETSATMLDNLLGKLHAELDRLERF